jgi:hypothetical protein
MRKDSDHNEELARLAEELRRVRQQSLEASRKGDFRTVARLTQQAADINRGILQAEGLDMPVMAETGKRFRTSEREKPSSNRLAELVGVA